MSVHSKGGICDVCDSKNEDEEKHLSFARGLVIHQYM